MCHLPANTKQAHVRAADKSAMEIVYLEARGERGGGGRVSANSRTDTTVLEMR